MITFAGTGFLRCLVLLCLFICAASPALAAKTYSDNLDGTVTDPTTGLTWMRCSMGQTWDGTTCTGIASTYTWDQANALTGTVTFAGQSDWRLPNIRELQTIVDRTVYNPAIDSAAFPNTSNLPGSGYWSSSSDARHSANGWGLSAGFDALLLSGPLKARLIRGAVNSSLLAESRPTADYKDNLDGTVEHTPSGLVWQRCTVQQTWTGQTCEWGASGPIDWWGSKSLTSNFAGKTDWRVPSVDDLVTLTDYKESNPALNTELFPNAPGYSAVYWSRSTIAVDSSSAWAIYPSSGESSSLVDRNFGGWVRLVRGGAQKLVINKSGTGHVQSVEGGIDCGNGCSSGYDLSQVVTLMASPAANLISWGGDCAGAGTAATCTVTMDAAKTVTASFNVSGQGTWESTLLGRDTAGHAVAASSPNATFLYDTTLDVTWLKNANANGQMTWQDAQAWVQSLQVGSFAGWRLPKTLDPDASCGTSNANPAVYSNGYGINCMGSEMGHLFNVSLGNAPDKAIANTGNFENVQGYYYWSGTPLVSSSYYVWTYQTSINGQAYAGTGTNLSFALAVRDGDVLVPTPQPGSTTALNLQPGWNLLGNGQNQPLAVATLLGDPLKVTSVWKWDVTQSGWQFYAPSMDAAALQTYATSKNYGVLSTINAGEGFWVNAAQAFISSYPSGTAITGIDFQAGKPAAMKPGWNLVAIGNPVTPSAFNVGLGTSPPSPGVVPINLTTLWAWDSTQSKWYFYAPSFEAQGGTALIDYVTGKGYLDFTTGSKKLGPGVGFWVNRP